MRSRRSGPLRPVDLTTTVGSLTLRNPVMTASGTAGHGDELGAYVDLSTLGAVVVKSLSTDPWAGNPAPRVHETPAGMLNSVGLQGPGVRAWLDEELPAVIATGATVVASNITVNVPEPATLALVGLALAGAVTSRRRRA